MAAYNATSGVKRDPYAGNPMGNAGYGLRGAVYKPPKQRSGGMGGGGTVDGDTTGGGTDPTQPQTPSMPSFADLLNSDPWFQQYKADMAAQSVADKASRDAAIQQSLTRYGEVPENFSIGGISAKDLQGIITPEISRLAALNTSSGMSLKARTAQTYQDTLDQVKNVLAARGGLQSGETGYQLGRTDQQYNRTVYDQKNELLDYVSGVQQGFLAAERARQQALFQAQLEAMMRAMQNGGGDGSGSDPINVGGGEAPTRPVQNNPMGNAGYGEPGAVYVPPPRRPKSVADQVRRVAYGY